MSKKNSEMPVFCTCAKKQCGRSIRRDSYSEINAIPIWCDEGQKLCEWIYIPAFARL